jgi:two-component system phosphate regulon response regulator OmpR
MIKRHALIVDDDKGIRNLLKQFLTESDYIVSSACATKEARVLLAEFIFDIVVMDIVMPEETGIEFIKNYELSTPVILLSALGDVDDRINGLESGADDYIAKPFDPRELLIRMNKLIERTGGDNVQVVFGIFKFDIGKNALLRNDEQIHLTTVESNMLAILVKKLNKPVDRDEILQDNQDINPRTIDTQIARIRSKIEENPKKPRHLITIRGFGYMLRG